MSKSKGNGIDPILMIEEYGADALRFTVTALATPGRNVKLSARRVEEHRSFVTKLWNAARFCELNNAASPNGFDPAHLVSPLARWIVGEANDAIAAATSALNAYRFDDYATTCYRFTWNSFCDWFLELAKPGLAGNDAPAAELRATAGWVLSTILRLCHPVMPFVTEALADHFGYVPYAGLIRAAWPEPVTVPGREDAAAELGWVTRAIGELRGMRASLNVPAAARIDIRLRDASPQTMRRFADWHEPIARMARAGSVQPLSGDVPPQSAQLVLDEATLVVPLGAIIDIAIERARLDKEHSRLSSDAAKLDAKLASPDFVDRAKPEIVEETRERLAIGQADITRLAAARSRLI